MSPQRAGAELAAQDSIHQTLTLVAAGSREPVMVVALSLVKQFIQANRPGSVG